MLWPCRVHGGHCVNRLVGMLKPVMQKCANIRMSIIKVCTATAGPAGVPPQEAQCAGHKPFSMETVYSLA